MNEWPGQTFTIKSDGMGYLMIHESIMLKLYDADEQASHLPKMQFT